jgi:putative hemolysin
MEIFILVGLILLNGVFAMSEIAIVTARKSRLAALAERGSKSAAAALKLADDPTQFLSTVQIGITSIGIMNGIFGESILAEPFSLWLQSLGLPVQVSNPAATGLVVVVVTYVTIVVGELVPKRLGQVSAENIACIIAPPMMWLARVARPFVILLSSSTHWLMKLLRFKNVSDQSVTEEDIQAILLEGSTAGVIEQQEHRMVRNVLLLDDRKILSLMVPRSDIVYLDLTQSLEYNYQRVMQSPHSRFPICEREIDNIIGVVSAKELLAQAITGDLVDLASLAKPANFVPPSLTGMELLDFFRTSDVSQVFVVDEYGGVKGMVTLHDLLEALTGEFYSVDETESFVVTREDGSLLLDGLFPSIELKELLGLRQLPDEGDYQTLNGLILQVMGSVPSTGDKIYIEDWALEIVDMDGRRVDKVLASRQTEVIAPTDADDASSV